MKKVFLALIFIAFSLKVKAQLDTCIHTVIKHELFSKHLNEKRDFWVSLPLRYNEEESYPVLYVFDAEWRMELINRIVFDMGGNERIPKHIVIGIPHVEFRKKRGIDLTFSHSRIEYDGEKVDSTWYNDSNSGGAEKFYHYLTEEVMNRVNEKYATNGENILVGHSYGGYFGSYILGRDHGFTAFQIYDPSIWFSAGEAIKAVKDNLSDDKELNVFISYQPVPSYHGNKIEELIHYLSTKKNIDLGSKLYADHTHNSLFLPGFLDGLNHLYKDWKPQE